MDCARGRRSAFTRNHLPHPRRGAEDQERVAINQKVHGRPRRVAETKERSRAPRDPIQSDVKE